MVKYRTKVQQILQNFKAFLFVHILRSQNKYDEALTTLASKVNMSKIEKVVIIIKAKGKMQSLEPCSTEDSWIRCIKVRIVKGKIADYKLIRHFHIDNGILYYKTPNGVL